MLDKGHTSSAYVGVLTCNTVFNHLGFLEMLTEL